MDAFWSGTDLSTIDEFNEGDFSFALVVNLKEEYKFRVSVWKPFAMHKDVELDIIGAEKRFPKKLVDEVMELCNKPEVKSYKGIGGQRTLWHMHGMRNKKDDPIDIDSLINEPEAADYTQAYQLMTKLIDGACAGTVKYAQYSQEINEFNNRATEQDTGVLIGKLTQKDWEESILTTTPANHIIDTDDSFGYHSRWGI